LAILNQNLMVEAALRSHVKGRAGLLPPGTSKLRPQAPPRRGRFSVSEAETAKVIAARDFGSVAVNEAPRTYFRGRISPAGSSATSGDRARPSLAQSRHWNRRPPIFRSKNRIGLWHFGQTGGGVFLGMTRTLDRRERNTRSHRWMPRAGGDFQILTKGCWRCLFGG
jgi:hypothetical protein